MLFRSRRSIEASIRVCSPQRYGVRRTCSIGKVQHGLDEADTGVVHNDRGMDIPRLDFEDYRQIIMSSLRESNISLQCSERVVTRRE